eukprot:CAMPEP_0184645768 /NCGR_PEP_ID=MMETSP0308-20130426/2352_1 /TAXON_ID=38269 /ORGANISM="Gloeochaete witrockiana, Strain SAG 46.84" /LENGTH=137 /DNA_ID=CAMNT_0027075145 /DNA_START=51 /DNA_END=461 /DNA_ORIENTATION=-
MSEGTHPLQQPYCFWFLRRNNAGVKAVAAENYASMIKKIGCFSTVEGFWSYYSHLVRPEDLPLNCEFHLFKEGIRPVWEDDANKLGGKWILRLKKGLSNRFWEELIIALVGEQFDAGEEICGAVISIRYEGDILSIW